ncbi:unnamed protein product, partial [Didymodactylos carnosus]
KSDNNTETDQLEFKIDLPCSQYLKKTSIDSTAFASLLSNTETSLLTSKYSMKIASSHDLDLLTNYICQTYRFTVVDKIGNAASLYSESILGHPVAILLKKPIKAMINLTSSSGNDGAHQQMRKTVEQLRFEVNVHRERASSTLNDLIKFCQAHAPADYLIVGFQHKEQNPWKERRMCSVI